MVSIELAAHILRKAKEYAPAMVPQPSPEMAASWAEVLDKNYPPELWVDAVRHWAKHADRMICPRDMLEAAQSTKRTWETHPVRGPQLRAHRDQQTARRDRELAEGTFMGNRGYKPRPALETPQVDEDVLDRARRAARGRQ